MGGPGAVIIVGAAWASAAAVGAAAVGRLRLGRVLLAAAAGLAIVALALLGLALWRVDTTLVEVATTTSRSTGAPLRLAGMWAGPVSSLLCFATVAAIAAAVLARCLPRAGLVAVAAPVAVLLGVAAVAEPFRRVDLAPLDGTGLVPVLRRTSMLVHPPVVYAGLALVLVLAALGVADLAGQADDGNRRLGRQVALVAWSLLALGMVLGSRWAHREVGWGGVWAWDPVEDAALLPWLAITAGLHHRSPRGWWVGAGLLTWAGAWTTRSGRLASVHAFSSQGAVGTALAVALIAFALALAVLVASRRGWLPGRPAGGRRGQAGEEGQEPIGPADVGQRGGHELDGDHLSSSTSTSPSSSAGSSPSHRRDVKGSAGPLAILGRSADGPFRESQDSSGAVGRESPGQNRSAGLARHGRRPAPGDGRAPRSMPDGPVSADAPGAGGELVRGPVGRVHPGPSGPVAGERHNQSGPVTVESRGPSGPVEPEVGGPRGLDVRRLGGRSLVGVVAGAAVAWVGVGTAWAALGGSDRTVAASFYVSLVGPLAIAALAVLARGAPRAELVAAGVIGAGGAAGMAVLGWRSAGVLAVALVAPAAVAGALARSSSRGAALAHLGFVVLVAGAVATTTGDAETIRLAVGDSRRVAGVDVRLDGFEEVRGRDHAGVAARLVVAGQAVAPALVEVEQLGPRADVVTSSSAAREVQAALVSTDGRGTAVVSVSTTPGAVWVWGGGLLLAAGGIVEASRGAGPGGRRRRRVTVAALEGSLRS